MNITFHVLLCGTILILVSSERKKKGKKQIYDKDHIRGELSKVANGGTKSFYFAVKSMAECTQTCNKDWDHYKNICNVGTGCKVSTKCWSEHKCACKLTLSCGDEHKKSIHKGVSRKDDLDLTKFYNDHKGRENGGDKPKKNTFLDKHRHTHNQPTIPTLLTVGTTTTASTIGIQEHRRDFNIPSSNHAHQPGSGGLTTLVKVYRISDGGTAYIVTAVYLNELNTVHSVQCHLAVSRQECHQKATPECEKRATQSCLHANVQLCRYSYQERSGGTANGTENCCFKINCIPLPLRKSVLEEGTFLLKVAGEEVYVQKKLSAKFQKMIQTLRNKRSIIDGVTYEKDQGNMKLDNDDDDEMEGQRAVANSSADLTDFDEHYPEDDDDKETFSSDQDDNNVSDYKAEDSFSAESESAESEEKKEADDSFEAPMAFKDPIPLGPSSIRPMPDQAAVAQNSSENKVFLFQLTKDQCVNKCHGKDQLALAADHCRHRGIVCKAEHDCEARLECGCMVTFSCDNMDNQNYKNQQVVTDKTGKITHILQQPSLPGEYIFEGQTTTAKAPADKLPKYDHDKLLTAFKAISSKGQTTQTFHAQKGTCKNLCDNSEVAQDICQYGTTCKVRVKNCQANDQCECSLSLTCHPIDDKFKNLKSLLGPEEIKKVARKNLKNGLSKVSLHVKDREECTKSCMPMINGACDRGGKCNFNFQCTGKKNNETCLCNVKVSCNENSNNKPPKSNDSSEVTTVAGVVGINKEATQGQSEVTTKGQGQIDESAGGSEDQETKEKGQGENATEVQTGESTQGQGQPDESAGGTEIPETGSEGQPENATEGQTKGQEETTKGQEESTQGQEENTQDQEAPEETYEEGQADYANKDQTKGQGQAEGQQEKSDQGQEEESTGSKELAKTDEEGEERDQAANTSKDQVEGQGHAEGPQEKSSEGQEEESTGSKIEKAFESDEEKDSAENTSKGQTEGQGQGEESSQSQEEESSQGQEEPEETDEGQTENTSKGQAEGPGQTEENTGSQEELEKTHIDGEEGQAENTSKGQAEGQPEGQGQPEESNEGQPSSDEGKEGQTDSTTTKHQPKGQGQTKGQPKGQGQTKGQGQRKSLDDEEGGSEDYRGEEEFLEKGQKKKRPEGQNGSDYRGEMNPNPDIYSVEEEDCLNRCKERAKKSCRYGMKNCDIQFNSGNDCQLNITCNQGQDEGQGQGEEEDTLSGVLGLRHDDEFKLFSM